MSHQLYQVTLIFQAFRYMWAVRVGMSPAAHHRRHRWEERAQEQQQQQVFLQGPRPQAQVSRHSSCLGALPPGRICAAV